ncbi:MAG: hypothetical protein R3E89_16295 [Thiolinea sp.]
MTAAFAPPYPKRHKTDLGAFATLWSARRDLLSFWTEDSFRFQFMRRQFFNRTICIANTPELVKEVFVTKKHIYESKSPQMRKALEPLLGDGLFISDGELWKNRRLLQNGLFDTRHIIHYTQSDDRHQYRNGGTMGQSAQWLTARCAVGNGQTDLGNHCPHPVRQGAGRR